jgi:hypothetical protein
VGGGAGLERPGVERLAVAGAGGTAEVLDELCVGYLTRGGRGRRACHGMDGEQDLSRFCLYGESRISCSDLV